MSYNFKKIIDLDLVNEVPEGANVLIETEGATKRLPSTAIKPAPIQPDFAQNDSTAPDYVKNRTHYEETSVVNEPLNITWDGNTEGLVCVNDYFYKVSDAVLTDEQIKSATVGIGDATVVVGDVFDDAMNGSEELLVSDFIAFCRKAGATIGEVTFPEIGIYFVSMNGMYVSSLTTTEPIEQTKTVVHKLDKKYLPDDIGGGIKTAIIKDSWYDNTLAGLQIADAIEITYSCINMTFEEAYQTMASGKPLSVFFMLSGEGAMNAYGMLNFIGNAAFGVPCLVIGNPIDSSIFFFWTADGISTEQPGGAPA